MKEKQNEKRGRRSKAAEESRSSKRALSFSTDWCIGWKPHSCWMTLASLSKSTLKASVLHDPSCCCVSSLFSDSLRVCFSLGRTRETAHSRRTEHTNVQIITADENKAERPSVVCHNVRTQGQNTSVFPLSLSTDYSSVSSVELAPIWLVFRIAPMVVLESRTNSKFCGIYADKRASEERNGLVFFKRAGSKVWFKLRLSLCNFGPVMNQVLIVSVRYVSDRVFNELNCDPKGILT